MLNQVAQCAPTPGARSRPLVVEYHVSRLAGGIDRVDGGGEIVHRRRDREDRRRSDGTVVSVVVVDVLAVGMLVLVVGVLVLVVGVLVVGVLVVLVVLAIERPAAGVARR